MTVEALADTSTQVAQPAVIQTDTTPVSEDAAMDAVWDRLVTSNGAERENGKFVSPDPEKRAAAEAAKDTPLEGGEGEAQADTSTVAADAPLPANWNGLDEVWAKIPVDARTAIAEHQQQQHAKLSDMGRKVATYEPLQQAASEFAEYFNGNLKGADGKPIQAADGIRYLANIQRMMDKDSEGTILSIIDTYGVRDKIAARLGGTAAAPAADPNAALLDKIDRLEKHILTNGLDPSKVEQIVDRRESKRQHEEEVIRLTSAKPLFSKIPDARMVFFINEAWTKLGDTADKAAVLDHAYNAAIEADPALRAQSEAAKKAAADTAAKAEAAKRGTSVNLRSTGTGAPRTVSEDEAMEEVWRKHH